MSDIEVTSVCEEGYTVESDIDGEWQLVADALGEEICHVHSALREGLHADISVEDDVF